MVIFNKKWKKYNEIQLTKNIMDLNIRKMTNHPPSPETMWNTKCYNAEYKVLKCSIKSVTDCYS